MQENNELKVFKNEEFGNVRVVEINNEGWLVGKDVAEVLGYERSDNAIRNHVDEEDKLMHQISASGQSRNMVIINESGLYSLVLKSKLPSAKKFKRWVTSEVLPSIRKHGAYMTEDVLEQAISNPSFAIGLLTNLKEEKEARLKAESKSKELEVKIETDKPKVDFANAVHFSKSSITMSKFASILNIKGFGRNKLYGFLRGNGYLKNDNDPYRKYIENGIFEVIEGVSTFGFPYNQVLITGKGQLFLYDKIKAKRVA